MPFSESSLSCATQIEVWRVKKQEKRRERGQDGRQREFVPQRDSTFLRALHLRWAAACLILRDAYSYHLGLLACRFDSLVHPKRACPHDFSIDASARMTFCQPLAHVSGAAVLYTPLEFQGDQNTDQ